MTVRMFFITVVIGLQYFSCIAYSASTQTQALIHVVKKLFKDDVPGIPISVFKLPSPYHHLLTQPLMTKGIESFYERNSIIHTLYSEKNNNNTYSRAIIMLLDKDKKRNKPVLAEKNDETLAVELAFITINFAELPDKLVREVLTMNTPFGKLLMNYQIQTYSKSRKYFSIQCNNDLSRLTHCNLNSTLYGRNHILTRSDNNKWLARVTEILTIS